MVPSSFNLGMSMLSAFGRARNQVHHVEFCGAGAAAPAQHTSSAVPAGVRWELDC